MVTWQDLQSVGEDQDARMQFIRSAITKWQTSDIYKTAKVAYEYDKKQNPDIKSVMKFLYTVTGQQVPDTYSSNYRLGRAFFPFFVSQEVQYLLGNGVTWENQETADRLGIGKAKFDTRLQKAGRDAVVGGCSFGFWNYDHVDIFSVLEFVPFYDEENGALRSGVRYWQIDPQKPFRATLYEEDGYTDYIWSRRDDRGGVKEAGEVLHEKRPYIIKITGTAIDESKIYQGENYPTFPIVPFWGNTNRQSEIIGLREQIAVYDIIKSGFCNTVEDASYVYWAIRNAPGMDERDLAIFLQKARQLHALQVENENGASAEPKTIEVPYQSREALLDRLEKDLFKDAMAFDPEKISGGAVTATQIRAAYDNLELKCNDFEYCVIEFVDAILELAGVDDNPTFTRSKNVNVNEEVQTVMQAATALDDEYVTRKILTIMGDGDQADEVMARKIDDEVTRQREIDYAMSQQTEDGEVDE